MNKWFFLTGIILIILIGCNNDVKVATGCVVNRYLYGLKESEGCYRDSLKTGIWKDYYPSGKIRDSITYLKGVKNGKSISFFENGKRESETNYRNGHFFGIVKFYYSNGVVNSEETWDDKGNQGEFKLLYESGKLRQKGIFHDGKIIGISTQYYENGKVESYYYYNSEGKKDSVWRYYNKQGSIIRTEFYKADSLLRVDSLK